MILFLHCNRRNAALVRRILRANFIESAIRHSGNMANNIFTKIYVQIPQEQNMNAAVELSSIKENQILNTSLQYQWETELWRGSLHALFRHIMFLGGQACGWFFRTEF